MILITQGVAQGFELLRFQRTKRVRKRPNQFEMHPAYGGTGDSR